MLFVTEILDLNHGIGRDLLLF